MLGLQVSLQCIARLIMQAADRAAHLFIRICGYIFHQKIDQARIALQDSQNLNRAILRTGLGCGFGSNRLGLSQREPQRLRYFHGELPGKENCEKAAKSKYDPVQISL